MDLIERYLAAVGRDLTDAQRADVLAELRDVLLSQVEEREAQLGRRLDGAETAALIRALGHPMVVAGRFRGPRQLIGPEIYPFWWASLKAAAVTVAAVYLVLAVVKGLLTEDARPLTHGLLPSLWGAAIWVFGLVTLAFAAIEAYVPARVLQRWRVDQLPPAGRKPPSRFESAASLTLAIVFLLWWTGAISFRNLVPDHATNVVMAAVWQAWWWPILAFGLLEAGLYLLRLISPYAAKAHAALGLVWGLAGVVICAGLLRAGHWVEVAGPTTGRRSADQVEALFDQALRLGLIGAIAVFGICAAGYAWRLNRAGRRAASAENLS